MDILIQILYALLAALVLFWLGWVTYCLFTIYNKTSSGSEDLQKSIKEISKLTRPEELSKSLKQELANLLRSPNDPNSLSSALKTANATLSGVNESVNIINQSTRSYGIKIDDYLLKIKNGLDDIAKEKAHYDEQKKVLSEKIDTIGQLNEKIKSLDRDLLESKKSYDLKIQEINELNSSYSIKLREKDNECAQLIHDIKESNRKELEKYIMIKDIHNELHIPVFIKKSLETDIQKLCDEVTSGNLYAESLWTSLGSFKSSCSQGTSPEFTFQILRQLGIDLVKYYASYGDFGPQSIHQKLNQWADCLNANSNDRFNLFIPALGATINNTLMYSTTGTAHSVTEVLCWGIRNPNGIVYSTALIR